MDNKRSKKKIFKGSIKSNQMSIIQYKLKLPYLVSLNIRDPSFKCIMINNISVR